MNAKKTPIAIFIIILTTLSVIISGLGYFLITNDPLKGTLETSNLDLTDEKIFDETINSRETKTIQFTVGDNQSMETILQIVGDQIIQNRKNNKDNTIYNIQATQGNPEEDKTGIKYTFYPASSLDYSDGTFRRTLSMVENLSPTTSNRYFLELSSTAMENSEHSLNVHLKTAELNMMQADRISTLWNTTLTNMESSGFNEKRQELKISTVGGSSISGYYSNETNYKALKATPPTVLGNVYSYYDTAAKNTTRFPLKRVNINIVDGISNTGTVDAIFEAMEEPEQIKNIISTAVVKDEDPIIFYWPFTTRFMTDDNPDTPFLFQYPSNME